MKNDEPSFVEREKSYEQKLDFICVGFTKCGTSSLQKAFAKTRNIYLPKVKETLYLSWADKEKHGKRLFKELYFHDVQDGQIVGDIEPSYHDKASACYEYHGGDLKVIMMMRNPVNATYSYFKMLMRKANNSQQTRYYKKYGSFCPEMFEDYIRDEILTGKEKRFCYDVWIKEYLKYYEPKQIKYVFFEDVVGAPQEELKNIQVFIGAPVRKYKKLPSTNVGKEVSKNYFSAKINRYLYMADRKLRRIENQQLKAVYGWIKKKIHKHTLVENHEKMPENCRKLLQDYYQESIHNTEILCQRTLTDLWN